MQEDDRLIKIIKKYGMKNWTLVSEKLTLGSTNERTGKQCRERYHLTDADGTTTSIRPSTMMPGASVTTRYSSKPTVNWAASGRRSPSCSSAGTVLPTQDRQLHQEPLLLDSATLPPPDRQASGWPPDHHYYEVSQALRPLQDR